MATLAHFFSLAASAAAVALGVVPRLGPGRALALGASSRLFGRAAVASARTADVAALRTMLETLGRGQYVVVAGPKGVGKTCVIESATQRTCGVVTVRVHAGAPEEEILADVFTAVARFHMRSLDQRGSVRRVLWWHALLFRTPATVVLRAAERKPAQAHADLDSAARALASDFGVRVVIDASDNSLPDAARATLREKVLDVEPMPRATLEALPELAPLLAALRKASAADAVWACLGGVPAAYEQLDGAWADAGRGEAAAARVAACYVQDALGRAIGERDEALAANGGLAQLYARFAGAAQVPLSALAELRVTRPAPDKVLRAVRARAPPGDEGSGARVLVPAHAAAALVLRHSLAAPPSMARLRELTALRGRA
jgi:hypothetical protein